MLLAPQSTERGFLVSRLPSDYQLSNSGQPCLARGALPHDEDPPAHFSQLQSNSMVSLHVCRKLAFPKDAIRRGCGGISATSMTMPKAPMDKQHRSILGKDQVRPAGQVPTMKTKPQTRPMEKTTYCKFRRSVTPLDAGHHPASGLAVDYISHLARFIGSSAWPSIVSQINGRMTRAVSLRTGTTTELPNCL